jgi:hypothetical protein
MPRRFPLSSPSRSAASRALSLAAAALLAGGCSALRPGLDPAIPRDLAVDRRAEASHAPTNVCPPRLRSESEGTTYVIMRQRVTQSVREVGITRETRVEKATGEYAPVPAGRSRLPEDTWVRIDCTTLRVLGTSREDQPEGRRS